MSASPISAPFPPANGGGVGPPANHHQQQQLKLHLQQQHDTDQAAIRAAAAAVEAVHRAAAVPPAGYGVEEDEEEGVDIPGLEDKRTKRGFSKRVTLRDLERYFEYPIEEVSKMMGVSTTIIKRLCRKYGIKRWPYRQVRCGYLSRWDSSCVLATGTACCTSSSTACVFAVVLRCPMFFCVGTCHL